ncbi:wax ester synthase/diacylglycerol acyltransferase 11-like isoform X4 [Mercurialis annua]|uniref:wax ester synthase/diacylglycerol acyltransferase 11-like isoform X4 n=1 Tax=Mercurialis annua TaxID=3986 RepID=UPI0021600E04|nr:wax ester synthase/diacylglycerol acyltransferase 11-like isoform X4 [Mercurialis annua]
MELSPCDRMFHAPLLNCHILSIIGLNAAVDPTVLKFGLQQTLIKHPRFSSKLSINERKMKWTPTIVNLQDHVIIPKVDPKMDSPDQFVEDYVSRLTTIPTMDLSKPLWEIHILNIKTSNAQSICVFKIHHSIGDAVSLMSLLLASTRKKSDPKSLPTIPSRKRAGSNASNGFMWMKLRTIWNTFVDMILFGATILFLEDTKTSLKGSSSRVDLKPKRVVYRIVSLDDIKVVKTKMNISLETLMSKESKQKKWGWGNKFGYMVLPFETALQNEPLDYVRQAKATVDRKKDSLEALCSFRIATLIVNIFGAEVASAVAHRFISNTTMALSNVVGPIEEISFYGHPIQFLATTVYGHPHALTIHYQSYFNKMTIVVAVDPDVIPNPHKLCDHLEESLNIIKNAVLDKGFDAA